MVTFIVIIFGLASLVSHGRCEGDGADDYANFKLVQLKPINDEELDLLRRFKDARGKIEVLKHSRAINDTLDLLVPPDRAQSLLNFAQTRRLNLNVKSDDYGRSLEEESTRRSNRRSYRDDFDVLSYNSYRSMLVFQRELADLHPACVEVVDMGTSYDGRPIRLTKISTKRNNNNPVIFVDAGIHAREWVASAMAMYLMKEVAQSCDQSENNPDSMLNGVDWFILPMVNPDGYEFSRRKNRMWRKTRSKYVTSCYGVDGNRNYGFKWGETGTSSNPCDPQTYPGPSAFSEQETRIVRDVMLNNNKRIKLYVSLHAYGNYLVYPWGYTGDYLPEGWQKLDRLAKKVSAAIRNAGGEPLKVLSAGKWYAASGGSDDYAFAVAKIPYSFTMELTDGWEFKFPEEKLEEVLPQFYEGFKVFKDSIREQYGTK